jgi:hypothetical protein
MLEREDKPTPLSVVTQRRARPAEQRRCKLAARTEPVSAAKRSAGEGHAAALAEWLGDEAGFAEALGAQQAR